MADEHGGPDAAGSSCRFCGAPLEHTFVDLGGSPLCESFLTAAQLDQPETFYPLHARVCAHCFLVQVDEYVGPAEIFTEYAYFSSYSDSWLADCKSYVEMIASRLRLAAGSQVIELASNDGYLLQYFQELGVPVVGIEPAANIAKVANANGIETLVEFFGLELAERLAADGLQADLLIGNNVLAQVPDLNSFVAGMKVILKPDGVATMEFPHLVRLVDENQFDTIYHEHFSYFSFSTAERIFAAHGLTLFDVEELLTHGGSLRIYARHDEDASKPRTAAVEALRAAEAEAGIDDLALLRIIRSPSPGDARRAPGVPDRGAASRPARRRATAHPARATRSSTTAACAETCSSSRSIAIRTSRGCSSPAPTSRSMLPIASPKCGPTTS